MSEIIETTHHEDGTVSLRLTILDAHTMLGARADELRTWELNDEQRYPTIAADFGKRREHLRDVMRGIAERYLARLDAAT